MSYQPALRDKRNLLPEKVTMEVNVAAVDPFRPDTELYNSKILTFELPILQEEIRVEPRQIKMNKRTSTATLRVISNR